MLTRYLISALPTAFVILTTWLSRGPIVCEVRCPGRDVDSYILGILETQLQRCGPEHLTTQPVSCTGLSLTAVIVGAVVTFAAGLALGGCTVLVWTRARREPRRDPVRREALRALPGTPSTLRAQPSSA